MAEATKNRLPQTQPPPSVAPPAKKGRTKLTPEQREARKAQLLAEPKDVKFRRLVNHRMPRALKAIGSIAHLANKSQYDYTTEQYGKILQALEKAVIAVGNKFAGNKDNGATFAL